MVVRNHDPLEVGRMAEEQQLPEGAEERAQQMVEHQRDAEPAQRHENVREGDETMLETSDVQRHETA